MASPMVVKGLLSIGSSLIDRLFPDKEAQAKAKLELLALEQSGELQKIAESSAVVQAEAKSEHTITATWRPITMLVFVAIIANNYILYPYLSLFWTDAPVLDLPDQMWSLLQIGLGGYVVGRSGEKIMKGLKEK